MANILSITTIKHPVLRQRARELTVDELLAPQSQRFIDDMIATMRDADGAGLAANQVYRPVRICVVEVRADNPRYPEKLPIPLTVLVNPVLTPIGAEKVVSYEGCLSVPDLRGQVARFERISVEYLDRTGGRHNITVDGIKAVTYQHECDHLDGKLFVDSVVDPTTLTTWKNFSRHHR